MKKCLGNVFRLPYFFLFLFKLTFAPRTKTSNKPQEGGKNSESESHGPHAQQSSGGGSGPGRQAFNIITTHAIVACSKALVWLKSAANPFHPHSHHQASLSHLLLFVCLSMHPCHLQS